MGSSEHTRKISHADSQTDLEGAYDGRTEMKKVRRVCGREILWMKKKKGTVVSKLGYLYGVWEDRGSRLLIALVWAGHRMDNRKEVVPYTVFPCFRSFCV